MKTNSNHCNGQGKTPDSRSKAKPIVSLLTSVVLAAGLFPAYAMAQEATGDSESDIDSAGEYEAVVAQAEAADDLVPSDAEAADAANSWRYSDGQLIDPDEISTDAEDGLPPSDDGEFDIVTLAAAWSDNGDGTYVNDQGNVIPNALAKGVDVSEHNGSIDWAAAKANGIDFAIIRCGYGMDYTSQDDKWWNYNVSECERLGIPYGVYLYSYADSTSRASSEADHVIRLLQGHNPTCPVYYDLEESSLEGTGNRSLLASMARTFCGKIEDAGYEAGVYANLNWWNNYLTDSVFGSWDRWVAQYNHQCSYTGDYNFWQCTSSGSVSGFSGSVDLDFRLNYPIDVNPRCWYVVEGAYSYMTSNGYMTGYSRKMWGTKDYFSRGQMAAVLWRMEGQPYVEAEAFDDVDYSLYYGTAINWARSLGIITGYCDEYGEYRLFGPEDSISREDFATMLARYASIVKGIDVSSDCRSLDEKPDAYQVSDYAREAMGWAVDWGIIRGVNGVYLSPRTGALRAEGAGMIYRFLI